MGEDLDMWGRIALKYPIAFSWQIGATYYMDVDYRACNTYSHFMEQDSPFVRTVHHSISKIELSPEVLFDLEEYIAKYKIKTASICLRLANKPKIARRMIMNSFPRTIRFRCLKYWWYFWTFSPAPIVHLSFYVKQKLLKKNRKNASKDTII